MTCGGKLPTRFTKILPSVVSEGEEVLMRIKSCLLFFILILLSFGVHKNDAISQIEMEQSPLYELPTFHYDLVNVASPDSTLSRLHVYLKIAFDELQFTVSEEQYRASYEFSVVIYDKDGNQVDGKIEDEEVTAANFDLTNSRQSYSTSYMKFDLEPGKYKISIALSDVETRKKRTIKDEFRLRNFSDKKLMVSDLAFVRNLLVDSLGVKSFHPDIANCIKDLTEDLYVYFEIYNQSEKDEQFLVSFAVKNIRNKEVIKKSYKRRKDGTERLSLFLYRLHNYPRENIN